MKKRNGQKAILIALGGLLISLLGCCMWTFYRLRDIQDELNITEELYD